MKKIIKLTGLIAIIVFSFFYTDKVVDVIRENDSLMIELENVKDEYKIKAINGTIEGNTIIPGLNGRSINIEKSYKKMHEKGIFDKELIQYDKITHKISITNNKDKFIISGNKQKNMVSLIFILENDKYLERIEDIATSKEITINYFVTYEYLVDNSTLITKMTNREFYNYGSSGEYTPDNLIFANNLLSRITDNEAIYCITKTKDENITKLCSENNLYTIKPNIIVKSDPYNEIKKKLEPGSIILMDMTNDTAVELGIIIDYIRGKGLNITSLSNHLSEEL